MRGLMWTAGGRASHGALQILVLAVLARLLSPADFGVVSAALVVIGFSFIFSQLGMAPAIVQRAALESRHLQTAFAVSLAFGTSLGVAIWSLAPAAAGFLRIPEVEPVIRVLAWVFPLRGLAVVAESLLQRELRFKTLALIDVCSFAFGYGPAGLGLALAGWGVWALVGAHLTQTIVRTTVLLILRPPNLRTPPEVRAFKELFHFGAGFTLARVGNYLALQGDNLVVGRWLGPVALGIYGRAYHLMATPAFLLGQVLDTVLFPSMARIQGDRERLTAAYLRGVAAVALATLPLSAILVIVAPELIRVVLGPQWTAVTAPFRLFALGLLFRTSYKISDSLARATGVVYRRAWRQFAYAAAVVVGAWIGQRFGVTGVAVGVVGAVAMNFTLMTHLSLDVTRASLAEFASAHVPALRLAALVGSASLLVVTALRTVGSAPFVTVAATLAAGSLLILGAAWRRSRLFLGADGLWMLDLMRQAALGRLRAATSEHAVQTTVETAA